MPVARCRPSHKNRQQSLAKTHCKSRPRRERPAHLELAAKIAGMIEGETSRQGVRISLPAYLNRHQRLKRLATVTIRHRSMCVCYRLTN